MFSFECTEIIMRLSLANVFIEKNKNNEFYAEHCVADATDRKFFQHLNVLNSKQNNAVVCLSILCLKRIFGKIMKPLLLPREVEYVCLGFVCFNKIYKLFCDMNALNSFSTRTIVQYVDCQIFVMNAWFI